MQGVSRILCIRIRGNSSGYFRGKDKGLPAAHHPSNRRRSRRGFRTQFYPKSQKWLYNTKLKMIRVDLRVSERPDERVRSVLGPEVVEYLGVPDDFVHHLSGADGMRRRARSSALKGPYFRVAHMGHVIRAVEVLAIPTRWEADRRHDTLLAGAIRELHYLRRARGPCVHAYVGQLAEAGSLLYASGIDISNEHSETLEVC